ncbi:hypothetical protein NC651_037128 [Populus alba x Populus x berolinensis]|nr:hypothetical protein NC651_037128 [Populus alba x Populus x berolinensis]
MPQSVKVMKRSYLWDLKCIRDSWPLKVTILTIRPVCLLESSFFSESEFRGNYFPMFGSVMENKLENTFQCLVMSWKMSWKITY